MAKTVTPSQNYKTEVRFGASGSTNVEFVPEPSAGTPEEFQRLADLTQKLTRVPKEELDEQRRNA